MRALKLTGPRTLELVDAPDPLPDGDRVVIRVAACGICGSDLHYWEYGLGMGGAADLIMGHEFCGVVTDPGSRTDLAAGDRVTALPLDPCGACDACHKGAPNICTSALKRSIPGNNSQGALAEFLALRPDMVRKLPDAVDDAAATLIEPAAVALHAIQQGGVRVGEKVLVVGGGPIGRLAAAWARMAGASLVGLSEPGDHRRKLALESGDVDAGFDPRDGAAAKRLKQASGGGFDAAVETSATAGGLDTALRALAPRGRLVLAGIALKPLETMTLLNVVKELTVFAAMGYLPAEFDHALDFMARGRLKPATLISGAVGLAEAPRAFEQLFEGKTGAVKIVVKP